MPILKIGDRKVIESGSVIIQSAVTFELSMYDMTFEFEFNDAGGDSNMEITNLGPKRAKFTFKNFTNPLGQFNTVLMEIAQVFGKKHYLSFLINGHSGIKSFTYTITAEV